MTSLVVRIRYGARDLWVEPACAGWHTSFSRDDKTAEIRFPDGESDFSAKEHEPELLNTPLRYAVSSTFQEPDWDNTTWAVRLFEVAVTLEAELPLERPENPFEGEYGRIAEDAFDEGERVASAVAHDFVRWLRVTAHHQAWLGLGTEPPPQYGRGGLYYTESGQAIFGKGPTASHSWRSSRLRLSPADLMSVGDSVAAQDEIPVARELLADAWHLAEGRSTPDVQRSVLMAAMASEIYAEQSMRQHADSGKRNLLAMMLDRSSSLTFILHHLFKATYGASMKDDDPDLYARVQTLAKRRNAIVHDGVDTEPNADARDAALTADDVFAWLDTTLSSDERASGT